MRIPVFDAQGKRTQDVLEFDEQIFGERVRQEVLREAVLMYEARQRQGTHSTKTRGQVAGSGRKLWKQKGTGRARVGPARAPHWKGGGVVFGPHPRDYSYSMPKKARRVAVNSAWLAKLQDKEIVVLQNFDIQDTPKTKSVRDTLKAIGAAQKTLVGLSEYNKNLWYSARNLVGVSMDCVANFSPYVLLNNNRIVLLRDAFEQLIKSRGGEVKSLDRSKLYS